MNTPGVLRKPSQDTIGLGKFETVFCSALFFVAPLEFYLQALFGTVFRYFLLFAIVLILVQNWYRGRIVRLNWYYSLFLFWLVYKITTLIWSPDLSVPKSHFPSQIGMVGFLFVLTSINVGSRQRKAMLSSFFMGSMVFCLLSLIFMEPYMDYTQRYVLTLFGRQTDPNNAGACALPAFALSIYYLASDKRPWVKAGCALGSLLSAYVVLMTGSRGNLLGLGVIVLTIVFLSRELRAYQKTLLGIMIAFICLLVLGLLPSDTYERLFSDYGDGSLRGELWQTALGVFQENPLFGSGWGSTFLLLAGSATHNTILSMLAEQGVFGTALFIIPLVYIAIQSIKKRNMLPLVLLLAAICPALTIDAINKRFLWYGITMALICLDEGEKKNEFGRVAKVSAGQV